MSSQSGPTVATAFPIPSTPRFRAQASQSNRKYDVSRNRPSGYRISARPFLDRKRQGKYMVDEELTRRGDYPLFAILRCPGKGEFPYAELIVQSSYHRERCIPLPET